MLYETHGKTNTLPSTHNSWVDDFCHEEFLFVSVASYYKHRFLGPVRLKNESRGPFFVVAKKFFILWPLKFEAAPIFLAHSRTLNENKGELMVVVFSSTTAVFSFCGKSFRRGVSVSNLSTWRGKCG